MALVSIEELSLLLGIPVRRLQKLEGQGVIQPARDQTEPGDPEGLEEVLTMTVTIQELAEMLGMSVRRMQQLQQEGVIEPIPEGKKGVKYREGSKYYFIKAIVNLIDYYRVKSGIW